MDEWIKYWGPAGQRYRRRFTGYRPGIDGQLWVADRAISLLFFPGPPGLGIWSAVVLSSPFTLPRSRLSAPRLPSNANASADGDPGLAE